MNPLEQAIILNFSQKLDFLRAIIVKEGNAKILDEFDKLRHYVQLTKDQLTCRKKPSLADHIQATFFGLVIFGPWIYGVLKLVGIPI